MKVKKGLRESIINKKHHRSLIEPERLAMAYLNILYKKLVRAEKKRIVFCELQRSMLPPYRYEVNVGGKVVTVYAYPEEDLQKAARRQHYKLFQTQIRI